VNDAPALKRADVGIAVEDSTDAARGAADLVLTQPGLSVIVTAIVESRKIFQRMLSYSLFATATTVRIVVMFSTLIFAWKFNFPPFLILIIALLNDGSIMSISTDRVSPSPKPDKWKFTELFVTACALGLYLSLSTLLFFHIVYETSFFENHFSLDQPWRLAKDVNDFKLHSLIYLQVSISGQLMIFSTRSLWFWFTSRPGHFPMLAFCFAQAVSTVIAVFANWDWTEIEGIGWKWAGVAWVWSLIWFIPMDLPKLAVRLTFSGELWKFRFESMHHVWSRGRGHVAPSIRSGSVAGSIHRASLDEPAVRHRLSIADTIDKVAKVD
jgi:H+-transporting ATPase